MWSDAFRHFLIYICASNRMFHFLNEWKKNRILSAFKAQWAFIIGQCSSVHAGNWSGIRKPKQNEIHWIKAIFSLTFFWCLCSKQKASFFFFRFKGKSNSTKVNCVRKFISLYRRHSMIWLLFLISPFRRVYLLKQIVWHPVPTRHRSLSEILVFIFH